MAEDENFVSAIQLHELRAQQPAPLVVDVRSSEQYEAGHIPGARNIPKDELLEILLDPPLNREIIVYCDMKHPGSSRSEQAAEMLRQSGYIARTLRGGFSAWENAGYPVDSGYNGMGGAAR